MRTDDFRRRSMGALLALCLVFTALWPGLAFAQGTLIADWTLKSIVSGQNPGGSPAFEKTADAIYTYDFSDNDGFNSKGIRHCGALLLPGEITGDFEICATVEPLRWYRNGTGAVVGVALFAADGDGISTTNYFSLVERGDGKNQITAYYRRYKDGAYGLAALGDKADAVSGGTRIVLSRTGTTMTATVDGTVVCTACSGTEKSNYDPALNDAARIGLVFDGCDARITELKITVGDQVRYDQSADDSIAVLHTQAPSAAAVLTANDTVSEGIGVDWALDIPASGYDALWIAVMDSETNMRQQQYLQPADGVCGTWTYVPEAGGAYLVAAKGLYRQNGQILTGPETTVSLAYAAPLAAPVVTAQIAGPGSVTLSWTAQAAATGYSAAYQPEGGETVDLGTITPGESGGMLSYTVAGLANGAAYWFTVTATDGVSSMTSQAVSCTPLADAALWQTGIFGSSTKQPTAQNIADGKYCSVTQQSDGTVLIESVGGAGKLQDQHDGIAWYYTRIPADQNCVLSADVKLVYHGTAGTGGDNKQQSFGIMMRDVPGKYEGLSDSSYGYSNMVALAPYDLSRPMLALRRLGVRPGALSSTELTDIQFEKLEFPVAYPKVGETYHMRMEKNNTGFVISLTDPATGAVYTQVFYDEDAPDLLLAQDPQAYYAGFFASREAKIEVSNLSLVTTLAANDPPAQPKPVQPIVPTLAVVSAAQTGNEEYLLCFKTNVAGKATITRADAVLGADLDVVPGENSYAITLLPGENALKITVTPDAAQTLTAYDPLTEVFAVALRVFDGDIYAAPQGREDASGSALDPTDLPTAVLHARPGQRIILAPGEYRLSDTLVIPAACDGTEQNPVMLLGGGQASLDFGGMAGGVILEADYWQIHGLTVQNSADNGLLIRGSHHVVSDCVFTGNGDTGLQISGRSADSYEQWPAYNRIVNCESCHNRDASDGNADGFAAKLACGDGNVFDGCIAHHNSDDGWDLYVRTGDVIGAVTIANCVAYQNGYAMDHSQTKGDGNGFKLGGESVPVCHSIYNCAAFDNRVDGFTANSNPTFTMTDVTSFRNGRSNFVFAGGDTAYTVRGALSVDGGAADQNTQGALHETNYFSGDARAVSSLFASTQAPERVRRNAAGQIRLGDFLYVSTGETGADLRGETDLPAPTNAPSYGQDDWILPVQTPARTEPPVQTSDPDSVLFVPAQTAVPIVTANPQAAATSPQAGSITPLADIPKTGDASTVPGYAAVLAALAALSAVLFLRKKAQ